MNIEKLVLSVPNYGSVQAPKGVPAGGSNDFEKILQTGVSVIILIAIIIALFTLILAGIQWITSGGDKEAVSAARRKITYVIIGLVIIFFSFAIIFTLNYFFGIELIREPIIPLGLPFCPPGRVCNV